MILELFCLAFVATFVALAVLGHVLLFSAIYSCWRDDGSIERFKSKPRLFELAFAIDFAIEGEACAGSGSSVRISGRGPCKPFRMA